MSDEALASLPAGTCGLIAFVIAVRTPAAAIWWADLRGHEKPEVRLDYPYR
ncbi:MAG: hypothetical protein QOH33_680 [Paraburkholderia sp.]|jgi:hypothetical protein|nr:hypothetical protein [Paraburkholderia sp.]